VNRLFLVPALAALLGGCASPNHAAHESANGETCTYRPGGSGLLGLAAAVGAFDREVPCSALQSGRVVVEASPPSVPDFSRFDAAPVAALPPPALPPLPDMSPRLIVPSGGGTLMELGGPKTQLMVPAGGGYVHGATVSEDDCNEGR
jgi:hypothetical protein